MQIRLLTLFFLCSFGLSAQEQNISGKWQHSSKPAIIQFNMKAGEAFIYQHNNASSAGLNLIKNITPTKGDKYQWLGQMYDGYQNQYVTVTIRTTKEKTLIITTADKQVVLTLQR